jgi:hypothetical protein
MYLCLILPPPPPHLQRSRRHHEEESEPVPSNIMYDRRVVRGNTYQAQVVTSNQARDAERLRKEQERRAARERAMQLRANMQVPRTPPAVPGRQHMVAQTDEYLEELSDRPLEVEAETQTQVGGGSVMRGVCGGSVCVCGPQLGVRQWPWCIRILHRTGMSACSWACRLSWTGRPRRCSCLPRVGRTRPPRSR